jgi:hypothetical protein
MSGYMYDRPGFKTLASKYLNEHCRADTGGPQGSSMDSPKVSSRARIALGSLASEARY